MVHCLGFLSWDVCNYYYFLINSRQDTTTAGHVLGNAASRGPRAVPERSMNTISMSVLRVILHATMVAAAIQDERVSVHNIGFGEITGTLV